MIEIVNLKIFKGSAPLNLSIPKKLNIITAKNGGGKTMLFDYISGIRPIPRACGEINGNHNMVYFNQNLYLSHRLKAKDLVEFICDLDGIKNYKSNYFSYVANYTDKFDFSALWNKPLGMMSGGERKLLYFSAITMLKREWYILDEPFAAIDKNGKDILIDIITNLVKLGKGILLVSHEDTKLNLFADKNEIHLSIV